MLQDQIWKLSANQRVMPSVERFILEFSS